MKDFFICLTILECLNVYLKWFGVVQYELIFSKEIFCVFLGYVHDDVHDLVFLCLFKPCLAWHRVLT